MLKNADLARADLRRAVLVGADLQRANFTNAVLKDADIDRRVRRAPAACDGLDDA